MNNNSNDIFAPVLSSCIVILLELLSQRSNRILHCYSRHHQLKTANTRIIKLRYISAPRSRSHIKNTLVLTFQHIQCLHLMYSEVAWVPVSSGTQVQSQIILDPDYLPDDLFVSYDYVFEEKLNSLLIVSFFSHSSILCKDEWNFEY